MVQKNVQRFQFETSVRHLYVVNSWYLNRVYSGHEVALITSEGDTIQAYTSPYIWMFLEFF